LNSEYTESLFAKDLSSLRVVYNGNISVLHWRKEQNTDVKGWNILRGDTISSLEDNDVFPINTSLIECFESNARNIDYSFEDLYYLFAGNIYYYWLESIDNHGLTEFVGPVHLQIPEELNKSIVKRDEFSLFQNYPNPFRLSSPCSFSATRIKFRVEQKSIISLEIFNIKGELIKTILNETISAGTIINTTWNGTDNQNKLVGSGMYLLKMKSSRKIQTKKMIIIK
jgi:hypothetical protein